MSLIAQCYKCSQKFRYSLRLYLFSFVDNHFTLLDGVVTLENFIRNHTEKIVSKLKKTNELRLFLFACLLDYSYISYR